MNTLSISIKLDVCEVDEEISENLFQIHFSVSSLRKTLKFLNEMLGFSKQAIFDLVSKRNSVPI